MKTPIMILNCESKLVWDRKSLAKKYMKKTEIKKALRVYHCTVCGRWHLTSLK